MNKRSPFSFVREDGARVCMSADNPKYDPDAAAAYNSRCCELRKEVEKSKEDECRAFFLLQIIEAPLNLIRFVRWCFKGLFGFCKHIEEETRPK